MLNRTCQLHGNLFRTCSNIDQDFLPPAFFQMVWYKGKATHAGTYFTFFFFLAEIKNKSSHYERPSWYQYALKKVPKVKLMHFQVMIKIDKVE